jgi:hypothetical protein
MDKLEELGDPDIFSQMAEKKNNFFPDSISAPSMMKYIYGKIGINQYLLRISP